MYDDKFNLYLLLTKLSYLYSLILKYIHIEFETNSNIFQSIKWIFQTLLNESYNFYLDLLYVLYDLLIYYDRHYYNNRLFK